MFVREMIRRILALVMSAFVLVSTLVPSFAMATPTSSQKQAQAREVARQVEALDDRLDIANENYNIANIAYNEAIGKRKAADTKLKKTEKRLNKVQLHLNTRATDMYRNGETGFADVLFGAKSFDEFAALWDLMNDLNRSDAANSIELKQLQTETEALRVELLDAEAESKAQNDKMKSIKAGAENDLAQRKAKLRGLEAEVAALQQAEAAAALRESQARAASSSYLSGGKTFPPPTRAARSEVVNIAKRYLGAPYRWGASGPNSFDCSGFTMFVFRQVGVSLPHSSRAQINSGQRVSRADLQPGDLVFFRNPIGHVGIYVGGGQMIHSPRTGDVVRYSPAFRRDYVGACRP
jgi:cell wall-associated NlpC family hydrolase